MNAYPNVIHLFVKVNNILISKNTFSRNAYSESSVKMYPF